MMHAAKKSDAEVVATKAANNGAQARMEPLERRAGSEGNAGSRDTGRTRSRETVPSGADRIRQHVKEKPKEKLTALLHHITPEALGAAYATLKRDAAPGVDGMTWEEYGQGLDGHLHDLHRRVHTGAYRAAPVRRVKIPQPDGGERPYEAEFIGFSYGFRPGRGAHDALDALAYGITKRKINWVLDADISRFFDCIDRDRLGQLLERRIGDRRVLRLIRKWLNAGVMEAGLLTDASVAGVPGTPCLTAVPWWCASSTASIAICPTGWPGPMSGSPRSGSGWPDPLPRRT